MEIKRQEPDTPSRLLSRGEFSFCGVTYKDSIAKNGLSNLTDALLLPHDHPTHGLEMDHFWILPAFCIQNFFMI
jgi:hypothetical protein